MRPNKPIPANFTEDQAVALTRNILDAHGQPNCRIKWVKRIGANVIACQTYDFDKQMRPIPVIELSSIHVPALRKHEFQSTVCHEIVHAVLRGKGGRQNHGKLFQKMAFEMGIRDKSLLSLIKMRKRARRLGFVPRLALSKDILEKNRQRLSEIRFYGGHGREAWLDAQKGAR